MTYRVVIFGTTDFGLPAFSAIAADPNFELTAVVTQPPRAQGRHLSPTPTPVDAWASRLNIPIYQFTTLKDEAAATTLGSLSADIFLVASYGLILPANILSLPQHGCLNIHGSILPNYRGASPIAAALLAGDLTTGITFMLMDQGIDTGPTLASMTEPIEPLDTKPRLEKRLAELAGANIVRITTAFLTGSLKPQPQLAGSGNYVGRVTKEDGRATWESASLLEKKIRAYHPWPGLWTSWHDKTLKILAATYSAAAITDQPGTVIKIDQSSGWAVVCADGLLIPQTVQFAGRQPQPAATIPSGYPGFIGSILPAA